MKKSRVDAKGFCETTIIKIRNRLVTLRTYLASLLFKKFAYNKSIYARRNSIATLFIRPGRSGTEIGAAQHAMNLPKSVNVKYLDRIPKSDYVKQLKETDKDARGIFVDVDIIDDAERLETIGDCSQDFVIANHVLEHCIDPIAAVHNMLRVLKNDGILFLSIPDKRFTFDAERQITTIEHLLLDHKEPSKRSHRFHFEEFVRLVEKVDGEAEIEKRTNFLMENSDTITIHYHVWTQREMLEMFVALKTLKNDFDYTFDIEFFCKNRLEVIFVFRKTE